MKTWVRRLSLGLLAVGVAVWLSGCLSAKYFATVRYDEAKDEFTVLNVYQRITSPTPGDSEYLYHFVQPRSPDSTAEPRHFDMPAFLRISP